MLTCITKMVVILLSLVMTSALLAEDAADAASEESAVKQPTSAPSKVMAEIRGKKFTWGELESFRKLLRPSWKDDKVIELWKFQTVLVDDFQKSGMMDDADVQAALKLETGIRKAMIYIAVKTQNVEVSDNDIEEEYKKSLDRPGFRHPPVVSVKLIAGKKRADVAAIKTRLVAGEDFDEVMNEFAEQTKKITGLSEVFVQDVASDTLQGALGVQWNSLARVAIDKPIGPRRIAGNNYAMIKVVKRTLGEPKPIEEVREKLKTKLLGSKKSALRQKLLKDARKEAGIKEQKRQRPRAMPKRMPTPGKTKTTTTTTTKPKAK